MKTLAESFAALLAVWGRTRSAPIAELIEELGFHFDDGLAPLLYDTGRRDNARRTEAFEALARRAPDPRVARWVLGRFEPVQARRDEALWRAAGAALLQHADPRFSQPLRNLARRYAAPNARSSFGVAVQPLREVHARWDAELEGREATTAEDRRLIDRWTRWVTQKPRPTLDPTEAGMLRAIVADAVSDDPVHLYADWLLERGDPRGAHIRLELELGTGAAAVLERSTARWEHEASLLGPLGRLATNQDVRYERGLLVQVRLRNTLVGLPPAARHRLVTDLRWSTVRKLELDRDHAAILRDSPLWSLRELVLRDAGPLAALSDRTPPITLDTLELAGDLAHLGTQCAAFAQPLEPGRLLIRSHPLEPPPDSVLRGIRQLRPRVLHWGGPTYAEVFGLGVWLSALRRLDLAELVLETRWLLATCTPREDGRIDLHLLLRGIDGPEQVAMLRPWLRALRHHRRIATCDWTWAWMHDGCRNILDAALRGR